MPMSSICVECAEEMNAVWRLGHCATFWPDDCIACKKEKSCCCTSDWDWPEGQKKLIERLDREG